MVVKYCTFEACELITYMTQSQTSFGNPNTDSLFAYYYQKLETIGLKAVKPYK